MANGTRIEARLHLDEVEDGETQGFEGDADMDVADGTLRRQDMGMQDSMQYHKLSKEIATLHRRLESESVKHEALLCQ